VKKPVKAAKQFRLIVLSYRACYLKTFLRAKKPSTKNQTIKQRIKGAAPMNIPMMKIGQQIPDIELEAYHDDDTKKIRLSDYKGKWIVLLFYPADFSFVCPTELEEAAAYYEEFKKAGAEVLSISTDTVFVHKAWHDASPAVQKITFPMLADPTRKACMEFGTYIEEEGLSRRATFIIDLGLVGKI